MKNASFVPFVKEHMDLMDLREDAQEVAAFPQLVPVLEKIGFTILAADGVTPLGVMGVADTIPGVCEVFIIATKTQSRFPVSMARIVKKELFRLRLKYRRIQATSKGDDFHYRWLSWLGFHPEGVLRKYGLNGEDMIMWGMT